MEKPSKVKFERACLELINDENFKRIEYWNIKKDGIPVYFLKSPYRPIAEKYLPHDIFYRSNSKGFPVSLIVDISKRMNVYVTDLITYIHMDKRR